MDYVTQLQSLDALAISQDTETARVAAIPRQVLAQEPPRPPIYKGVRLAARGTGHGYLPPSAIDCQLFRASAIDRQPLRASNIDHQLVP